MNSSKQLYWHFAGSCCLVLFVILGYIVKFYVATVRILDEPLTHLLRDTITTTKSAFFLNVTKLGNSSTIALLLLLVAAFLWLKKFKAEAIWLAINTALIGGFGNWLIKFAFQRPRPTIEHLIHATHYSFPSGHAMASLLFYGTLILLLPLLLKNKTLILISQVFLGLLIISIGLSRIYAGVHFPTDILGGYLLGGAWLLGSYPTFIKQRFVWRFKGQQK